MKFLYVIPARGGSKGIPGKNKKNLNGKPLIAYTIECAMQVASLDDICISTDDAEIIKIAQKYGLQVPFMRPDHLSNDTASAFDVIKHAGSFYESIGRRPTAIVLLQPTSPFRSAVQLLAAIELFKNDIDMVVSVSKAKSKLNFIENEEGFLTLEKGAGFYERRQDGGIKYNFNGAIYIINYDSLIKKEVKDHKKIIKFEMDEFSSFDIDTSLDWYLAECLICKPQNV